jgi:hypothetical protein
MPVYDNEQQLSSESQSILATNRQKEKRAKSNNKISSLEKTDSSFVEDKGVNSKSSVSDIETSIRQRSDLEKWSNNIKYLIINVIIFKKLILP